MQRPGDDRDETTGLHTPESLRKGEKKKKNSSSRPPKLEAPEAFEPKPEVEEPPHIKKLIRFVQFREIIKLKKYLQELGGEVAALSSETKKRIGRINIYKHAWNSRELEFMIVDYVRKGDYLGAMGFVENNEQYILESWIDDYLMKSNYYEAAITLRDYAKIKPSKQLDEDEMMLEEQIDEEILGAVEEDLGERKLPKFIPAHDRVWSLTRNGCYIQAAELCELLNVQAHGGEPLEASMGRKYGQRKDTIPSPMNLEELSDDEEKTGIFEPKIAARKPEETPEEVERRHKAELFHALPNTPEKMREVFGDLPELISRFHHLSNIDENNQSYIDALKGTFERDVNKLFEEKKIVIKEMSAMVPVQEELLGIIEDLGYLGFSLYINHRSDDNKVYLMVDHEAAPDYYTPVDITSLSPNDILIDDENFIEESAPTLRMDEERTLTGEEPTVQREAMKFTWVNKVITVKPEKAHELRWAA